MIEDNGDPYSPTSAAYVGTAAAAAEEQEIALHASLWEAINEYAEACGGDTSSATCGDRRMNAVAAVELVLAKLQERPTALAPAGVPPGRAGNHGGVTA